jgi:MFS family permease
VSVFGFVMRFAFAESDEFKAVENKPQPYKMRALWTKWRASLLLCVMVGGMTGCLFHSLIGFLNTYVSQSTGIPLESAMRSNVWGLVTYFFGCPFFGFVFDHSPKRRYWTMALVSVAIGIMPAFWLLSHGYTVGGQIVFAVLASCIGGVGHAYMQTLFPVQLRYRGVSVGYSVGQALFAGTTPLIALSLMHRMDWVLAPALVFIAYSLFALISFLYLEGRAKQEVQNELKKTA